MSEGGGGGEGGEGGEEGNKNPDRTEATPILTFMTFLMKCQLCLIHGHLHAPRFFGTGQKSRSHRGHANFNFHDLFDQMPTLVVSWAPARASIFRDWTKIPTTPRPRQF